MKNVILKISGSCLILSIILYIIYTIRLFSNDYGNSNLQSLFYILINSIPLLILSLYCFGINGTKAGNIIYRTGFCICVVSWLYMQLRNNYIDFNIYAAFNLLFLLIIIYFVIIGFKSKSRFSNTGYCNIRNLRYSWYCIIYKRCIPRLRYRFRLKLYIYGSHRFI